MRGTSNRNVRGNSADRKARRAFLLEKFGIYKWLFKTPICRCYRCKILLTEAQLTIDRIVPGARGGRYTRDNIRPACGTCNSETGGAVRRSA